MIGKGALVLLFSLVALAGPAFGQEEAAPGAAARISGMELPYEVDAADWAKLQQQLIEALERQPPPTGDRPPLGEANAIGKIALKDDGMGRYWLEWNHLSRGDFDQDDRVNEDDMVFLARALGKSSSDPKCPCCAFFDTDGDGAVGIPDVEVIARQWGTIVTAFEVLTGEDPGTAGAPPPRQLARVSFDDSEEFGAFYSSPGVLCSGGGRFVHRLGTGAELGRCFWVRPLAGELAGQPSVVVCEPEPPARLTVVGECPVPPCKLKLQAGPKLPKGTDYEWDLDGDGRFNEKEHGEEKARGKSEAALPVASNRSFAPAVRVTAGERSRVGKQALSLTTAVPWAEIAPDYIYLEEPRSFADGVVVFLAAGHPAVLYTGADQKQGRTLLRFRRSLDVNGRKWGKTVTLTDLGKLSDGDRSYPSDPDVARFSQVVMLEGRPAVAYAVGLELFFIAARKADGSSWSKPVCLVAEQEVAGRPALAMDGGKPVVAWNRLTEEEPDDLCVATAADSDGEKWNDPESTPGMVEPEDQGQGPQPVTIARIDGRLTVLTEWRYWGEVEFSATVRSEEGWSSTRLFRHNDEEGMSSVWPVAGLLDLGAGQAGTGLLTCVGGMPCSHDLLTWSAAGGAAPVVTRMAKLPTLHGGPLFAAAPVEPGFVDRLYLLGPSSPVAGGGAPAVWLSLRATYGGGKVFLQAARGGVPPAPWAMTVKAEFGAGGSNSFLSGHALQPEGPDGDWRLDLFVTNETSGKATLVMGRLVL